MARSQSPLIVTPGAVLHHLNKDEVLALCRQWESAFPADRREIHVEDYAWHVFGYNRYASVCGDAALSDYARHEAPKYLVLSNEQDQGLITDQRPTGVTVSDYLVCPLNWAWTMAFTHEDGWLGPYFARHRDYENLEAENRAGLRKRAEAEISRQRGWSR